MMRSLLRAGMLAILILALAATLASCAENEAVPFTAEETCPLPQPSTPLRDHTSGADTAWQERFGTDEGRLERYELRHRDDFAGAWLDNEAQKVRVRFARNVDEHERALLQMMESPDLLDVGYARFTLADLAALMDEISDEKTDLEREGIDVTLLDAVEPGNVVEIGVRKLDDDSVCTLQQRYGADRIRVVRAPEFEEIPALETAD